MIRVSRTWDTGTETKGAPKMQQAMLSIHYNGACIISRGIIWGANGLDSELPCFLLKHKLLRQASPAKQWHWFGPQLLGCIFNQFAARTSPGCGSGHSPAILSWWQAAVPVDVSEARRQAWLGTPSHISADGQVTNKKAGKQSPGLGWWMLYFLESERRDKPVKEPRGLGPFHCCLFSLTQTLFKGKDPEMRELKRGKGHHLFL